MQITQRKEVSILHGMLEVLGRSIQYGDGRSKSIHQKRDSYNYIPQSTRLQLDLFTNAFIYLLVNREGYSKTEANAHVGDSYGFTFMDAGCGAGLTLALARAVGFRYTVGLELDPKMVKLAKTLNPYYRHKKMYTDRPNPAKILQTDICTSRMYKKADVIYFYVPMSNPKWQKTFENQLKDTCKVGTIVIPTGSSFRFEQDHRFKHISLGCMFVKTEV
jgi:SAM-dependent methyltransferase